MSQISETNPCGIDGVDFVEYSGPEAKQLEILFERMGFKPFAKLANKNIQLFRQGEINFILNMEPGTFATDFAKSHGPSICSTGWFVKDAAAAFKTAIARGAKAYASSSEKEALPFPAIYGIGDSLVYFIDQAGRQQLYSELFKLKNISETQNGVGLMNIDHFTNNVPRGEMDKWCSFYENVFNFRQARYFHIQGKSTGLESKVMRSPCGKFSIPINEPTETKSQIQEYLDEYKGSGIQHLALTTNNITVTLEAMKNSQISFLTPPPHSYYAMLKERVHGVTEDVDRLEKNAILVDGDEEGYLLQIFTKNVIGPIFYELIQRKNHFGFGEGNFQALFDAIERDQAERGYL